MSSLFIYYMKPTNEALDSIISQNTQLDIITANLNDFGGKMHFLTEDQVDKWLRTMKPFKSILLGDIFWPTGQAICKWCLNNNVKCFFLQHGQWVYTDNKKDPLILPYCTLVFGSDVKNQIQAWPYGKKSRIEIVGSPRYDDLKTEDGDYVYCSMPVSREFMNIDLTTYRDNVHKKQMIEQIVGIDKHIKLLIHPHYRDGNAAWLKEKFPHAEFADPKQSALKLMCKSKQVLTHRNSTAVIDAIACKKRVTLMTFDNYSAYCYGYFGDFALESNNKDECLDNLKKSIINPDDYDVKASRFILLGNASSRILKYLLEIE